jgi:hypothetical protein
MWAVWAAASSQRTVFFCFFGQFLFSAAREFILGALRAELNHFL